MAQSKFFKNTPGAVVGRSRRAADSAPPTSQEKDDAKSKNSAADRATALSSSTRAHESRNTYSTGRLQELASTGKDWDSAQDLRLKQLYEVHGSDWNEIATAMKRKPIDVCRRWREVHCPVEQKQRSWHVCTLHGPTLRRRHPSSH
jgi:hypothetical protein